MTTAKRLTALEQAAEQAKAARLAVNDRLYDRVFAALDRADLEVLHDLANASPEREVEVWEAGRPYFMSEPERFPVIGWAIRTNEAPEDAPILPAPAGSVAQLEAWVADCNRTREELEKPTTAVVTAFSWCAALWRWWAALAREVGEQAAVNLHRRLEALEQAREGGAEPIEVWSQDEAEPGMFTRHLTGERLSRAELKARKGAQIILVMYGEQP